MDSAAFRPAAELFRAYSLREVIGQGQFGRVWRCTNRSTGESLACKQVRTHSAHDRDQLAQEIRGMQTLQGHRNVLRLLGLFQDDTSVYILTDLCDSGDLFDLVMRSGGSGGLKEPVAAALFAQIARAVKWCHAHNIAHRDIKPENILLTTSSAADSEGSAVAGSQQAGVLEARLADFGMAMEIPEGFALRGAVGSAPYEAPEVVARQTYGVKADVWSMGVLLYAMLAGKWPSFANNTRKLNPCVDFRDAPWPSISPDAKDLVRKMMTVDQDQRLTISEVVRHRWVVAATSRQETRVEGTTTSRQEPPEGTSARVTVSNIISEAALKALKASRPVSLCSSPRVSPSVRSIPSHELTTHDMAPSSPSSVFSATSSHSSSPSSSNQSSPLSSPRDLFCRPARKLGHRASRLGIQS